MSQKEWDRIRQEREQSQRRREVNNMPGFDGTGPMGMGPRTGGGFGTCSPGSGSVYGPGTYPRGAGRGFAPWGGGRGRVWGGGRGRGGWGGGGRGGQRWGYTPQAHGPGPGYSGYYPPENPGWGYAPPSREEEASYLRDQASALEEQLQEIRNRIDELSAQGGEEK